MSAAIPFGPDTRIVEPDVALGAVTARAAAVLYDMRLGSGMAPWPGAAELAEDLGRNPPGNLYRSRGVHFRWLILAGGQPVGWIGVRVQAWRRRRAELGYGLVPAMRGQGIMTRALRLLIGELFAHTTLETLVALCEADNRPSRRVLDKLSFRPRSGRPLGSRPIVLAFLSRDARHPLGTPAARR